MDWNSGFGGHVLSGGTGHVQRSSGGSFRKQQRRHVTDTQTGLMWADHDNGSDITWFSGKSYCEGYSGSGKSGWRMPTIDELRTLYTSGAYGSIIQKTYSYARVWSSETRGSGAGLTSPTPTATALCRCGRAIRLFGHLMI